MTTAFAIKVILAVLAVLFVSYGLLHEDKFVAFEDAVIRFIKKKVYLHKRRKAIEKRRGSRKDMLLMPIVCRANREKEGRGLLLKEEELPENVIKIKW